MASARCDGVATGRSARHQLQRVRRGGRFFLMACGRNADRQPALLILLGPRTEGLGKRLNGIGAPAVLFGELHGCDHGGVDASEVTFSVDGWPPVKNEAKSLLAVGHTHAERVRRLLAAARQAVGDRQDVLFDARPVGLELTLSSPEEPPADATNFLGGVGDVLEAKGRRGSLEHLQELAHIGLYENDRHIHDVRYQWHQGSQVRYVVRLWELTASAPLRRNVYVVADARWTRRRASRP